MSIFASHLQPQTPTQLQTPTHTRTHTQTHTQSKNKSESVNESEQYEHENVHRVYDQIAGHFSETRYKPWPIVEKFLKDLPDGAIGLDVGCGNGKYLKVNPKIFIVASDRSENLVKISSSSQQNTPHTSIIADTLSLPHPRFSFDFVISIAVIHHLSTSARRIDALAAIFETLRPTSTTTATNNNNNTNHHQENLNDNTSSCCHVRGRHISKSGQALIYVWALEQKHSRRGWDEGDAQDVMVPWVMTEKVSKNNTNNNKNDHNQERSQTRTFNRYYHLYRQGELEEDIRRAGGHVEMSGYEKDNWWAIASRSWS